MRRKLLIVDDSETNRRILRKILGDDYDIMEAKNGQEALTTLEDSCKVISAVLLDIGMPVMDGYEVLTRMRANPSLCQVPVIVTTGSTDADTELKALDLGANDYIIKPYKPASIKCRLRNTINLWETAALVNSIQKDRLTGLYNREAFFCETEALVAAHPPGYYVMTSFDIDNFKFINDQYGNAKGDEILKQLADIFQEGFAPIGGVCGRIMADKFATIYPSSFMDAEEILKIHDAASRLDGSMRPITFCIGRYIINDLTLSGSAMYDRAAIAAASVKTRFDNRIAHYDETMRESFLREQEIIVEMHAALEDGQFEPWFQPQYNHSSGALIGAEALVRWRHPKKGIVPPNAFIPVFERNGFIYEMDRSIWEQTCALLKQWRDDGLNPLPVSVNVSRYDIFREDFFDFITGLIERYELPLDLLRLEITESAFAQSAEQIITVVKRLIAYGFTVEIDDFGSGYSSLNTLKDVPANILKLDMRFLENNENSSRGGNILESIVRMAKWLGMPVIAEGVETREQANYLMSIGCFYMQGYLYARPMQADAYKALAAACGKEREMIALETVETLDNEAFWDPKSMETLIFNSYVGGACIIEYHNGTLELLRVNEKYAAELCGNGMSVEEALAFDFPKHLDDDNRSKLFASIQRAVDTGAEVACELRFPSPSAPHAFIYVRATFRKIAWAGTRTLIYCSVINMTAQRETEENEREAYEQLQFLNDTAHDLLAQPDADTGINMVLEKILRYFNASRAYVFELDERREVSVNTYEVCAAGVSSEMAELQAVPFSVNSAWWPVLRAGQYISIEDVDALDDSREEERKVLKEQGIRSLIVVPLYRDGALIGFIGVDDPKQLQSHVMHLQAIGDYMAFILTRRDLQAKIESDNSMLRDLMNDTPGGFVRMQMLDGNAIVPVYINDGFCKLLGIARDEIMQKYRENALWGVHPEDVEIVLSAADRMLSSGKVFSTRYRLLRGDGSYVRLMVFGRMTRNIAGDTFFNIYYTDAPMTEEERKERSFQEMLPVALKAMMAASEDLSFVKDRDFSYICCSDAFAQMVGLADADEVVGKTDYDLFDKALADLYRADDLALMESGHALVNHVERIPAPDGGARYSATSKYLLYGSTGNILGLYGIGRDVTADRETYARLKLITNSIPVGIASYIRSPEDIKLSYFSDGFCELLGYTREEYTAISENSVMSLVLDEDQPDVMAQVKALFDDGTPLDCTCRVRNRDADGYKWMNLRGVVTERHDDVSFANAVLYDITSAKMAEEAAHIHEQEMRMAMSQMGKMICEYDPASRTLTMPAAYAQQYDMPTVLCDMPSNTARKRLVDKAFHEGYDAFYNAILRGDQQGAYEYRILRADGTRRWERAEFSTIFSADGKPVKTIIAIGDTTEQHVRYELEQNRPTLGEENLLVHALFNLTTGETLDYSYRDGSEVPLEDRTVFAYGGDHLDTLLIDAEERAQYRAINDAAALLERYEKGETELSFDYRRRLPDGDIVWVRNILRLLQQPGGSDILLFEYFYNIEEEKTRELMYSTLVSENYDYVARINGRTRRFVIISNAGVPYGIPPQQGDDFDAVAREIAEQYVHPEDQALTIQNSLVEGIRQNLADQDRFQFTCRLVRPDGELRYKKITMYYLDRKRDIIILVREDVSSTVLEEMHKNELLADALASANQASQAKMQFLSRMSHELRTPMNAIIGLAALSATDLHNPESMADAIGKIGMSARYLLSLINDILEMSRIESGRMTLNEAPFDFARLIYDVTAIVYAQAEAKGVDYDVVVNSFMEPIYIGDATKMQEILVNILSNAVKFTPPGGKITMAIEQLKCVNRRATLQFVISDTGVGIDSEFLPHLFEPFSQENLHLTSVSSGTGLGLAITKNLVELMNGHIHVQSIKSIGSVFTVDVQLSVSEQSQQYLNVLSSMHLESLRALVVDDDVLVCKSTESILTAMGVQAEWAESGPRAVERVAHAHGNGQDFDTVFIDWKMPDMDGIETTRQIRGIVGKNVTIIIMTAYDWSGIEAQAREAGVDMFMEKPLFQSSIIKAFETIYLSGGDRVETPPAPPPDFSDVRILLAEDHPLNVEVARRLLEKVGAEVIVAGNGLEAMESYATAPDGYFDAILMDIQMPLMDGLTAAKNIRNLRKQGSRDIPIVAMTANAFDEDVDKSLHSGMDAHLAKPVEPQVLYAELRRLLKR